jgi:serine/threonine-protein kinase
MSDSVSGLNAALHGRYHVQRQLGEGGMATVYLADDLRHGRKVALKVLKPELAAVVGAERFLAEIKTTAALQHPHILPLFDSGDAGAFLFYVMPFVQGESLRERLDRERQLPIHESVRIAVAVASALEHAHRSGIVHRDIKPANILIHDGEPVISDFGIALALGAGAGSRLTETGLSLGTPHYMSPEQATGEQNVGPATDVYALGCVLYEMLAGEPPFTGSTPQAILGKIILGETKSVREQRPSVPPHVSDAVTKALEKVPADRFPSGGAFARALADTSFRWETSGQPVRNATRTVGLAAAGAAAAVTASLFVAWGALRPDTSETSASATALTYVLPDKQLLAQGNPSTLEISPNGERFAYVADEGGTRRIYVRELGSFEARPLAGTDGATSVFFSPDGQSVGFHSDGALRRVPVGGGIVARIADLADPPIGASWGADGTVLYAMGRQITSLFRVPSTGGTPVEIPLRFDNAGLSSDSMFQPREVLFSAMWPQHLPGTDLALVVPGFDSSIGVVDLTNGQFQPVVAGNRPYYLSSGHIAFYSGPETVSIVPFDLERLETTGPVVPVADDVLRPAGSEGRFSVSRDGTMIYARGGFDRQLVIVDRNGRETPVNVEPRGYRFPEVSPDGRFVAVTIDPQPPEIWVVDLASSRAQPVSTGGYHLFPVWSADGTRIAFNTAPGIAWVPWPGTGELTRVSAQGASVTSWPRMDRMLADFQGDLFVVDVASGARTDWLVAPTFDRQLGASRDGAWAAYVSDVSGADEVYVRALSGMPPATLVSRGGGDDPQWSADGSELYYRNGSSIMVVPVRADARFEVLGLPVEVFTRDYDFSNDRNWDVMPDGRFLMIRSSPGVGREIRVLTNWVGRVDFGAEERSR